MPERTSERWNGSFETPSVWVEVGDGYMNQGERDGTLVEVCGTARATLV